MKKTIKDVTINYEVKGEGQDLILLHGWGMNLTTFNNITRELSDDFKVYLIDLPGFGESSLPYAFSLDDYVLILRDFIQDLDIENPIILGHSFGGRIAMKYASLYNVSKLVLVSAPGVKMRFSLKKYLKVKIYKLSKKLNLNWHMGSKDYKSAPPLLRETLVKVINEDLSLLLPNITAKTLLIYGKKDKEVPLYIGKKINNLIKNSGFVVVPRGNHFLYIYKFRYFIIVLKHFLFTDES